MSNLNRRDFLKALGVSSGASALAACGLDNNRYATPVERILPYVVRDEQITPGTPTFFATTVTRGPAARPVTAQHRSGRVTNVGHNRFAPGRAAVGKASLLELQKTYSPDRVKGPTEGGQPTTWDAGLAKLAEAVRAAAANGKKVSYLGGYRSGAIVDLLTAFTAGNVVFFEPLGLAAEVAASEALFGQRIAPFYALDQARYVLSFGAPFLGEGWGDEGTAERFARARDPNIDHVVARFAVVAPKRDQTGANADDYLAAAPGSEVVVARAVAKALADRNGNVQVASIVGGVTLDEAAAASGLTVEQLQAVVENFATLDGLALPGGASGSTDLAVATYLINVAGGAAGTRFRLTGYTGPVHGIDALERLQADLDAGNVGVLLLDDVNVVYALPSDSALPASIGKAGLVVGLASNPDETQKLASLVLPTSAPLEDWGDESPRLGVHLLRQPSMSPLYDTRSLGDVLLAAGRAAGVAGLEAASWRTFLASWWERNVWDGAGDFGTFWEKSLVEGVVVRPRSEAAVAVVASAFPFSAAAVAGDGPYTLVAYEHPHLLDGRYANEPWGQELADPLTGNTWDSWLEVHPDTAKALGVTFNDVVTLTTPAGTVEVAVYEIPGIRPDTVALHFGQGHTDIGRYGNGRGLNAAKLFATVKDGAGQLSWAPVKVKLAPAGRKGDLASTHSKFATTDEGRHFAVHVAAARLAEVGDAESAHPGELTGIHHLALDKRLQDQRIEGFYGTPDHPTYRFGLTVDTNACTGCGACSLACSAENNLPVVGKEQVQKGRTMTWIRVNRYWGASGDGVQFLPMMCQHCGHAGCENVCPVLATYHNLDGLNAMVYNRCVGTRYCANACPYSVRRFNYHTFTWPEPFNLQLNPEVSPRRMGVMEKCTFCVQRLRATKIAAKRDGDVKAVVGDDTWQNLPACVEACPSRALTFGNLLEEGAKVVQHTKSARRYQPLEELRALSAVTYLAKASFHDDPTAHHGGGHGGAHGDEHSATGGHGEGHGGSVDGHHAPTEAAPAAGGAGHGGDAGHGAAPAGHDNQGTGHEAGAAH